MALHPRYREQFGLTDADADAANSFRFAARRAGWSSDRIDQAFAWYKEFAQPGMTPDAMLASFQEFTSSRGWPAHDVDAALEWFDTAQSAIDRGERPPLPPTPAPEDDAVRRGEIEQLMRKNPDAYWRDPQLQEELYEINARADGSEAPVIEATPAASARRAEIETMMRQQPGDYWRNSGVQAEYRALLGDGAEPACEAVAGVAVELAGAGAGES